jgi:hypothetical protein
MSPNGSEGAANSGAAAVAFPSPGLTLDGGKINVDIVKIICDLILTLSRWSE